VWTQGYRDGKPDKRDGLLGMDKGYTTNQIVTGFGIVSPDSIFIVAGDSNSDYPMMQLATKLVKEGKARAAICVDVGGKIDDTDHIIDVSFKDNGLYPHSQIDQLYDFLGGLIYECAPYREKNRTPKISSVSVHQPK